MKTFKISIIFNCIFLIISSACFSQNKKTDSLLTVLKTLKDDTTKVKTLNKLFWAYKNTDDKKAAEYANKTLELAKKIDYKKGIANAYTSLGYIEQGKFNYTAALNNFMDALKAGEDGKDQKIIARAYINMGNIYSYQGNYPDALKSFLASLKIREALGDKEEMAACYNNIGVTYYNQNNFKEALKNQFEALKLEQEAKNKEGIADAYNNVGITYAHMGNYDEALKYYLIAVKENEGTDNPVGLASTYNNIGLVYYQQGTNYPEALKNYLACLKIMESLGQKAYIAGSYTNIGNVYTKEKNYVQAKKYLDDAQRILKEIGNIEYLRDAYSGLVSLDSAQGDFKNAFENHKFYISCRDSLSNEDTRRKSLQTQMTYDFDKKAAVADAEHKKELENQQSLAEEKSRKQKVVITFVAIGLLLVLVFALFVSRSLRVTRKQKNIIELQKNVVEQQKQEVEHKNNLIEEKQKEIIDSINYARRIQYALLAGDDLLKQNLGEHFAFFRPKDIVSGDFYWAIRKDNYFYLAVCDSTGHGVPGAFMSLLNISFLNEAINEKNIREPNKVLDHVRQRLIENISQEGAKDGMDGILVCFDTTKNIITYAAAYNAPLLIRDSTVIDMKCDKMPVGYSEKITAFNLYTIEVEKGDQLFLYTDGYADQFGGPKGKKFMYKQLEQKLVAIKDQPVVIQKEILSDTFETWKGNLEQIDDVTIIGIKF